MTGIVTLSRYPHFCFTFNILENRQSNMRTSIPYTIRRKEKTFSHTWLGQGKNSWLFSQAASCASALKTVWNDGMQAILRQY